MRSRLAVASDEDSLVRLAVAGIEETRPGDPYDRDVIRASFRRYIAADDAAVWIAERDGEVIGFLVGTTLPFDHRPGCCALFRACHVAPGARHGSTTDILTAEFLAWSHSLGAEEVVGLNWLDEAGKAAVRNLLGTQKIGPIAVTH